jgi:hypothetical protein
MSGANKFKSPKKNSFLTVVNTQTSIAFVSNVFPSVYFQMSNYGNAPFLGQTG